PPPAYGAPPPPPPPPPPAYVTPTPTLTAVLPTVAATTAGNFRGVLPSLPPWSVPSNAPNPSNVLIQPIIITDPIQPTPTSGAICSKNKHRRTAGFYKRAHGFKSKWGIRRKKKMVKRYLKKSMIRRLKKKSAVSAAVPNKLKYIKELFIKTYGKDEYKRMVRRAIREVNYKMKHGSRHRHRSHHRRHHRRHHKHKNGCKHKHGKKCHKLPKPTLVTGTVSISTTTNTTNTPITTTFVATLTSKTAASK
ncbi:hypothetical protein AYI68_g6600, partial [Smittium mucronatum]